MKSRLMTNEQDLLELLRETEVVREKEMEAMREHVNNIEVSTSKRFHQVEHQTEEAIQLAQSHIDDCTRYREIQRKQFERMDKKVDKVEALNEKAHEKTQKMISDLYDRNTSVVLGQKDLEIKVIETNSKSADILSETTIKILKVVALTAIGVALFLAGGKYEGIMKQLLHILL